GIDRAAVDSALAEIATTARKAVESVATLAGKLRNHALDWTAGGELNHSEGNSHDAEYRRDHQKQTAENISAHQSGLLFVSDPKATMLGCKWQFLRFWRSRTFKYAALRFPKSPFSPQPAV